MRAYLRANAPAFAGTAVYTALLLLWTMRNWNLAPALNNDITRGMALFNYVPHLAFYAEEAVLALLGTSAKIVLGFVVLPACCFYLIVKIFRFYLDILWSLAIAFAALISFDNYPFRDFLYGLIAGKGWAELASVRHFEVMGFPIPALSTCALLLLLHYSIKYFRPQDLLQRSVLTALWAVHIHLHPIDALFGLCFWFSYLPIRLARSYGAGSSRQVLIMVLQQLLLALLFVAPALLGLDRHIFTQVGHVSPGAYYYSMYFAAPLLLLALAFAVMRIDPHEILFKFWHIFLLLLLEFAIVFDADVLGVGLNLEIVTSRIPLFFLHFYYYVPVLYFATRPQRVYQSGPESRPLARLGNSLFSWAFARFSKIYLPLFILLLLAFAWTATVSL